MVPSDIRCRVTVTLSRDSRCRETAPKSPGKVAISELRPGPRQEWRADQGRRLSISPRQSIDNEDEEPERRGRQPAGSVANGRSRAAPGWSLRTAEYSASIATAAASPSLSTTEYFFAVAAASWSFPTAENSASLVLSSASSKRLIVAFLFLIAIGWQSNPPPLSLWPRPARASRQRSTPPPSFRVAHPLRG